MSTLIYYFLKGWTKEVAKLTFTPSLPRFPTFCRGFPWFAVGCHGQDARGHLCPAFRPPSRCSPYGKGMDWAWLQVYSLLAVPQYGPAPVPQCRVAAVLCGSHGSSRDAGFVPYPTGKAAAPDLKMFKVLKEKRLFNDGNDGSSRTENPPEWEPWRLYIQKEGEGVNPPLEATTGALQNWLDIRSGLDPLLLCLLRLSQ